MAWFYLELTYVVLNLHRVPLDATPTRLTNERGGCIGGFPADTGVLDLTMPLRTHGRNGNHSNLDAKTNGHGDEDSSNSDGDSSLCE